MVQLYEGYLLHTIGPKAMVAKAMLLLKGLKGFSETSQPFSSIMVWRFASRLSWTWLLAAACLYEWTNLRTARPHKHH
jgi:hypothetical protein